jgi:mannosyltransferase OCH1-like enzyme
MSKFLNRVHPNLPIEIPNNIFQTWQNKRLPPLMYLAIKKIKQQNPRFNYYLFDDNECRNFIKDNFDYDVLKAYDTLIPGAYKADLWRYCILYKRGGIYLDIKYKPLNGFKFYNLLDKEYFVLDFGGGGIYNALMVCKPGNEILLKAIRQIVENVKNRYYGLSFLEPTGPHLLIKYFSDEEKNSLVLKHILCGNQDSDKIITYNSVPILGCYKGYLKDRDNYSIKKHYSELWNNRIIYK